MKKMMTVPEVAKVFEVQPFTVREWLRNGILEGVRPPGTKAWRIPREAVEKLAQTKYGDTDE